MLVRVLALQVKGDEEQVGLQAGGEGADPGMKDT